MIPNPKYISIDDNLNKIKQFISEIIIAPRENLKRWALITNQTPAAKIGYVGQHLASLITGVKGTGSGARGNDLADGSEVKSCNKIDQADKCMNCGGRVLRIENKCPNCGSTDIDRKDDSKWLFSVRDEEELNQYMNMERVVLILTDYPNFSKHDYSDMRISAFEIYPKEERAVCFRNMLKYHYHNIYIPKLEANNKTNPMNLHPWKFQFYKCNPVETFECIIRDFDKGDEAVIDIRRYIAPAQERNEDLPAVPMPTVLLGKAEWDCLINSNDFCNNILPLIDKDKLSKLPASSHVKEYFSGLTRQEKAELVPYLDERMRNLIPLRPVRSTQQHRHYQRN